MDEVQSSPVERWSRAATPFSARLAGVGPDQWVAPTPCAGWDVRDLVAHLVEWVPAFLAQGGVPGIDVGAGRDDPRAAWAILDTAIRGLLADPATAGAAFAHPQAGTRALADAVEQFVLNDVLVHTWDVARATGQDERLDAGLVASMLEGVEQLGDALEQSGHYGARVAVAAGADPQTRLLAATGRRVDQGAPGA